MRLGTWLRRWWSWLLPGLAVLALGIAAVYRPTGPTTPPPPTPVQTMTSVPTSTTSPTETQIPTTTIVPTPNATVAFAEFKGGYPPGWLSNPIHAAGATAAVERYNAYSTATVLTPTIPDPVWTREPTPTLGVGMITDTACWSPVEPGKELFDSCWETSVAGRWIVVGVGYKGGGMAGPRVGLIWVCPEPCHVPYPDEVYPAPRPPYHRRGRRTDHPRHP